jgi:hypothetical protein
MASVSIPAGGGSRSENRWRRSVDRVRYNTRMLYPVPIVVDADVLIRDAQHAITAGHLPRRLRSASGKYSLFTGVSLFSTPQVFREAIRHLPDVAERAKVPETKVRTMWNREVVPKVRVVQIDDHAVTDARVAAVRELHRSDAPTAALAALLAPAVLLTDNRKHFAPFGMASTKSDAVAEDTVILSEFGIGARGAMLLPTLGGVGVFEGSKRLATHIGKDGAALLGLLAAAGVWLFATSARGRSVRARVSGAARKVGPPLTGRVERALAASQRVDEFAVRRLEKADALAVVARRLAVGQPVMTIREVANELHARGFRFKGEGRFEARTRAWLVGQICFHELSKGHWSLGYHAAEMPVETND